MSTEEVKAETGTAAEAGSGADAAPRDRDGAEERAEAAKASRPKQRRMRDMAMSMAVLLVPIGLFYVGWNWIASDRQVSVVDTSENYTTAASLGLTVIEPALSEDWKPISTDLEVEGEAVTLRTGWYSPEGDGLQLVQTTGAIADVHEDLTGAGAPVESGGADWTSYELSSGEAWVAELAGATVILTAEPDAVNDLPGLAEGVLEAVNG
jgi:hypothetical protein